MYVLVCTLCISSCNKCILLLPSSKGYQHSSGRHPRGSTRGPDHPLRTHGELLVRRRGDGNRSAALRIRALPHGGPQPSEEPVHVEERRRENREGKLVQKKGGVKLSTEE